MPCLGCALTRVYEAPHSARLSRERQPPRQRSPFTPVTCHGWLDSTHMRGKSRKSSRASVRRASESSAKEVGLPKSPEENCLIELVRGRLHFVIFKRTTFARQGDAHPLATQTRNARTRHCEQNKLSSLNRHILGSETGYCLPHQPLRALRVSTTVSGGYYRP